MSHFVKLVGMCWGVETFEFDRDKIGINSEIYSDQIVKIKF